MRKTAAILAAAALAITANALTVEEARANLTAARIAYTNALHEAGITNTPRRTARARAKKAATTRTAANSVLTRRQQSFFENRRICTRRDAETLPGYVISYWERNGKPDTIGPAVVTNAIQQIVGVAQSNPLQGRIAELTEQYQAAIQRATSAEARAARADALKTWLEEQRDKAALPTTKAIYQAILNKLEE